MPRADEQQTSDFLTGTLHAGVDAGGQRPRAYGPGDQVRIDRGRFGHLQRKLKILRWLDRLQPKTFIDVASGWEHYPYLVRERYGAETYYSDLVHATMLPTDGPRFGRRDHAVTLNLASLPFRDACFDVVLCSEVTAESSYCSFPIL